MRIRHRTDFAPAAPSDPGAAPGARLWGRIDAVVALGIALVGLAVYLLLMNDLKALRWPDHRVWPYFGWRIYNFYFLSLVDGTFTVPARIVSNEGHFDVAGNAYVYQGVLPVLTRLLAWPFVDLRQVSLAYPTIAAFSALTAATTQHVMHRIAVRGLAPGWTRTLLVALLAGCAWFASGAAVAVSNGSFYHEPLAATLFFGTAALSLLAHATFLGVRPERVLIPAAICAGIALHGRLHLGLGFAAAVGFWSAWLVLTGRPALRRRAFAAGVVLCLIFASVLALNAARFGNPLQSHGGNDGADAVQHATVFWDTARIDRSRDVLEHGVFNPGRLPGNALLYLFGLPRALGDIADAQIYRYLVWVSPYGLGKVAPPNHGIVFMFLPWLCLIGFGVAGATRRQLAGAGPFLPAIVGTGTVFALMLTYATVAFRYKADLWPFVMALSLVGLALLARSDRPRLRFGPAAACVALPLALFGAAATMHAVKDYNIQGARAIPRDYTEWSFAHCVELAERRGFDASAISRICAP